MLEAATVASAGSTAQLSRRTMSEFFAPLPLAAVTLLALNDHLLKARFHNALTGKLSDLAICFFTPLFVSASLGAVTRLTLRPRLLAGALATATVFTVLKLSPSADRFYCDALDLAWSWAGLRFTAFADPTDLFCLPLVAAAFFYGQHRNAEELR